MSSRRPVRWSKKTDALVRHVAARLRPRLQSELGHWMEDNPRFSTFVAAHQDKIRKKLTTSDDEDSRLDVRSELLVAYLILADRRFELSFEAYGARRLGPDLSVTYRGNQRFNLEVTRLRATAEASIESDRLANVVAGKLRQLPGGVPNALVISTRGLQLSEETLIAALRLLKTRSERKDQAFFARHGLRTARDFYAQYLHLSGVFALDEATAPIVWNNREARHPLPKEAVAALTVCLAAACR
jgi:hypothetical protein